MQQSSISVFESHNHINKTTKIGELFVYPKAKAISISTFQPTISAFLQQQFLLHSNISGNYSNFFNNHATLDENDLNTINASTTKEILFMDYSNLTLTTFRPDFLQILRILSKNQISLLSFLLFFSFVTVFGNTLVILAVIRERYLHTATNYFITSLAVADCLVGLVVMPFSALYEVFENTWFFGIDWCDIWRSLDVLFSTASILNLCVISLDRYWAITDPFTYPMRMTVRRSAILICLIWACSSVISFPAIIWWRVVRDDQMPAFKCTFTEHLGYLVFSSTISFYLPLLVMVFTYYKIYRAAVIQTRSLKLGTKQILMSSGELHLTLRIHRGGLSRKSYATGDFDTKNTGNQSRTQATSSLSGSSNLVDVSNQHYHSNHRVSGFETIKKSLNLEDQDDNPLSAYCENSINRRHQLRNKNSSLSRKLAKFAKEKKAAKTLGIVMGVFIVCWLPFFVINLLSGFCVECIENEEFVSAVVTWLGWINSCMNPVIYVCWSRDFRR